KRVAPKHPLPAEAGNIPALSEIAPHVQELGDRYFRKTTLFLPALLLTFFYLAGFALCDSYIAQHFKAPWRYWIFPGEFISTARPTLFTFLGIYLFNLGSMVRRLYLADINEHVFWGAVNRLLLSMGLSIVILKTGLQQGEGFVYFSIGFLANIVLEW